MLGLLKLHREQGWEKLNCSRNEHRKTWLNEVTFFIIVSSFISYFVTFSSNSMTPSRMMHFLDETKETVHVSGIPPFLATMLRVIIGSLFYYIHVFVWNQKVTSLLNIAHSKWLLPIWYHTELKSQLCDVNFLIRKTSTTKVDKMSLKK